ncbi:hypothetical protein ColLi_11354 [Colletotrichum liriopes]|uniref:Uncharacterized protein n=1 Tax=Colletotrichum liriopes TaxID=708192 RepID=A0AA37GWF0_9PEZI|nr:hypothetical protein ColLi_11354 [Colletotrichum liriopes]
MEKHITDQPQRAEDFPRHAHLTTEPLTHSSTEEGGEGDTFAMYYVPGGDADRQPPTPVTQETLGLRARERGPGGSSELQRERWS